MPSLPKKTQEAIFKAASEAYQLELIVSPETPNTVVIKGIYVLVEEAKLYLRDFFAGSCTADIKLLPKHVMLIGAKVRENFKRLIDKYGVDFALNLHTNSLEVSGETGKVYQAKADAMKFLETFFASEVHVFEASSSSCLRDLLSYNLVGDVAHIGAAVYPFRAMNRFFILSESPAGLVAAKAVLQNKQQQWSELNESVDFEEFMYPMIIGKNGAAISALCKETHVSIEINRANLKLEIKGASKQVVQDAKAVISRRVEKMRAEHWEMTISQELIGFIIGKQGVTINKIRAESGANVDFDAKLYVLKVTGAQEKVEAAKEMILDIVAAEEKNKAQTRYVSIPAAAIPCVIGTKGATSRGIQDESGARLDVDRVLNRCVLKGR